MVNGTTRFTSKQLKHRALVRENTVQKDLDLLNIGASLSPLSLSELTGIWTRTIENLFEYRDDAPSIEAKIWIEERIYAILHSPEAEEMRSIAKRHLEMRQIKVSGDLS